jgi:FAD:protein FMN transferase
MKSAFRLFILCTVLALAACGEPKIKPLKGRQYNGLVFGKPYTIDCVGDSTNYQSQIDSIIQAFQSNFDMSDPNSVITRFNDYKQTDSLMTFIDSSRAFGVVYDLLRDLHHNTLDYYDPTTNPLKRAWMQIGLTHSALEPNLDSIFEFVGFDGAKMDLIEIEDDHYMYQKSLLRKKDARIEADFTNLARAVSLDCIADFLKSKNMIQFKISCDRHLIGFGNAVDQLNVNPLGISGDSTDQTIRLNNCAFTYKTADDKPYMIDATFGYPVENEMAYVAIAAPSLAEAEAFSEAFMIMGLEKAGEYYSNNEYSPIQSFIFYTENDTMRSASTEGFDKLLVELQAPSE